MSLCPLTTHQILSSILAAWTDASNVADTVGDIPPASVAMGIGLDLVSSVMKRLHTGYFWMLFNCLASAAYASSFQLRLGEILMITL